MENKEKFYKLYDKILTSNDLDIYEVVLLCIYLNKYSMFEEIFASDSNDAKYLRIDRHYVSKKRKHLEELGYIKCEGAKGKKTKIKINPALIENMGIKHNSN